MGSNSRAQGQPLETTTLNAPLAPVKGREDAVSRPCRKRRPSAREDGGVSGVSSSCGARGGFLPGLIQQKGEPWGQGRPPWWYGGRVSSPRLQEAGLLTQCPTAGSTAEFMHLNKMKNPGDRHVRGLRGAACSAFRVSELAEFVCHGFRE